MMSAEKKTRARTPWLTIGMQVMGGIAVWDGVRLAIDAARCDGRSCLSIGTGVLVGIWGLIALLTGVRGRVGFIALIVAIVTPLAIPWVLLRFGILFLVIVFLTTALSKGQLAPYYRWHKEVTP
jgi:hypothetical protein